VLPILDTTAKHMMENYVATLTAWQRLTDFAHTPNEQGYFTEDLTGCSKSLTKLETVA